MDTPLPHEWFAEDAVTLAPKLLGKIVRRGECAGIIVETEAYKQDAASHAFRITPRSKIMQDTYGHWYLYFTYGMHFCANVTTNKDGVGGVLIRAVEPIEGLEKMQERRIHGKAIPPFKETLLCSGPARFCQAFGITSAENGLPMAPEFGIYDAPELAPERIGTSGRIGIRQGTELPWRFFIKDNAYVSRKAP